MVAPITLDNQLIGVHLTYINHEGTAKASITPSKKIIGKASGGMIALSDISQEIIIAEGIETALTCQVMYEKPAVAAISSTNMARLKVPLLPLAQNIFIAQDNDSAGFEATKKLARRLYEEGRKIKILSPPPLNRTTILTTF
jgi:phage/plasmid primase-like uncharacterized protein